MNQRRLHNVRRWLVVLVVLAGVPHAVRAEKVRGTVVDAQSGAVLPSRVYLQTAAGDWLFARSTAEQGSAVKLSVERGPASVEKHVTLSADPFEVDVPPGTVTITVEHGKEYQPLTRTIEVQNSPIDLRLPLTRWIDMPARGWFSGDTHVHRSVAEMPNIMLAEDLHVTLPLTYWVREANQPAVQGKAAGDWKPELIHVAPNRVIWPVNTEYELFTVNGKPHTQGAVLVINQRQGTELAAPPVLPVAQAAHQTGALLDLDKHTWNWTPMIVPVMKADLFELANNHVWGTEFAFKNWTLDIMPKTWEIEADAAGYTEWGWIDWGFKTYYAFLNCGFRMRPTGGTGGGVHPVPVGFGRVYVQVPGEFTYEKWIHGLNAGHSFVTTGPMLMVQCNGSPGGEVFTNQREVTLTGTAESRIPLDRVELIVNGEVALTLKPQNEQSPMGGFTSRLSARLKLLHSSWVAVRCFDQPPGKRSRYAHSSPVHFEIDGPVRPRRREVAFFIERMTQEIARNRNVLTADEVAEYERALEIYRKLEPTARD